MSVWEQCAGSLLQMMEKTKMAGHADGQTAPLLHDVVQY
jgi:hypothetical protein